MALRINDLVVEICHNYVTLLYCNHIYFRMGKKGRNRHFRMSTLFISVKHYRRYSDGVDKATNAFCHETTCG